MTASVIVLTYNARQFISRCLDALTAQTYTDFETIVVDNASPDGTAAFVRDAFPRVQVIESPTNGGYGAGNNLGAQHAAGDMLVLCSDGVHKHAEAHDIGRMLRGPAPLARRCMRLIEFARARGSRDDATVLVVRRMRSRLARWNGSGE